MLTNSQYDQSKLTKQQRLKRFAAQTPHTCGRPRPVLARLSASPRLRRVSQSHRLTAISLTHTQRHSARPLPPPESAPGRPMRWARAARTPPALASILNAARGSARVGP